jgi:hypothetical protein
LISGLPTYKAVYLLLEPFCSLFWRWGLENYLPRLAFILPISASHIARITGDSHCCLAKQGLLII